MEVIETLNVHCRYTHMKLNDERVVIDKTFPVKFIVLQIYMYMYVNIFYSLFISVLLLETQLSRGCCWDPVFIPPQTNQDLISNVFFMFNKLRWEVIVHIVDYDIGGIAEHHFLNFLFIIIWSPWYSWNIAESGIKQNKSINKINHNHMEI